MLSPIVTQYVDAALAQLRRLNLMRWPGKLPEAMIDHAIRRSRDWQGWKSTQSMVTASDIASLQRETGLAFPPLYQDFLKYRHFIDLTEVGLRFERHPCDGWHEGLRRAYAMNRTRILDIGLLPFGAETMMDAGPVCFDTRYRAADGDCPVVFLDYENIGNLSGVQPLFSSARKMFECLKLVAENDLNFVYHDPDDDPADLPEKCMKLARFLSLDPDGAGGTARRYWTTWGVESKE